VKFDQEIELGPRTSAEEAVLCEIGGAAQAEDVPQLRVVFRENTLEILKFGAGSVHEGKRLIEGDRAVRGAIIELTHGLVDVPLTIDDDKTEIFIGAFNNDCRIALEFAKKAKS
jgi:hypothetical protein